MLRPDSHQEKSVKIEPYSISAARMVHIGVYDTKHTKW